MSGFRLAHWMVDAPLTGVCVERAGRYAAFAGGDGCVRIVDLLNREPSLSVHSLTQDAILAIVPDCRQSGFLCGADDGVVYETDATDGPQELARLARSWPDRLASHPCGLRAVSDGAQVRLLDAEGQTVAELGGHPSTVAGLAFDSSGRRLAVSHYEGVSLWRLDRPCAAPRRLYQRGSHLDLSWSQDDHFLVTTTQENMLHAWDLVSGHDTGLGPCIAKVKSVGWSADGAWLLASGADTVSIWSFSDGHLPPPAPGMLGRYSDHLVARICPSPHLPIVAAGYNDGGLELVSLTARPRVEALASPPGHLVTGLTWSPDGLCLLGGDSDGRIFAYRFDAGWLARLAGDD
ncbi:MAG: WD40 repeat domain-containing protein [Alphaproteobacteria bacterium]|nr:WD40 repeat domain-containing protein [Alphaproteobacteria bacterium]MCY4317627.1 WD40 repeat domain-containing protein [Alphaproteobacteria bacterium]